MIQLLTRLGLVALVFAISPHAAVARGFGGGGFSGGGFHGGGFSGGGLSGGDFHAGGFSGGLGGVSGGAFGAGGFSGANGGAYRAGGFEGSSLGGYGSASFGGSRGFNMDGFSGSSSRSGDAYSGAWGGGAVGGSYSHSYTGNNGGSIDTSGTRGAAWSPFGGFAAGGTRDTSITGPNGNTYDGSRSTGAVGGPFGGYAAGGSSSGSFNGANGSFNRDGSWGAEGYRGPAGGYGAFGHTGSFSGNSVNGAFGGSTAFGGAGYRFPTDAGMARYGGYAGAARFSTYHWTNAECVTRAGYIRSGFVGYGAFRPDWYAAHPGAWVAAGWGVGAAWTAASWAALASTFAIDSAPIDYDYGNTVVYQGDNVVVNGGDPIPAAQYDEQATNLASQGQQAQPPAEDQWTPLGVFSLVQGQETSSNLMVQLAVDSKGVIRGNYYDAVMNSTSPVFGSVDPKTQRAAWVVGQGQFPVFDAGIYNLTKDQSPVLVHFAGDKTQQWLMVRQPPPPQNGSGNAPANGSAPNGPDGSEGAPAGPSN
ncbi:MAG TPA: hypothetical protein VGE52_05065 [Pirellulales bacterium]